LINSEPISDIFSHLYDVPGYLPVAKAGKVAGYPLNSLQDWSRVDYKAFCGVFCAFGVTFGTFHSANVI